MLSGILLSPFAVITHDAQRNLPISGLSHTFSENGRVTLVTVERFNGRFAAGCVTCYLCQRAAPTRSDLDEEVSMNAGLMLSRALAKGFGFGFVSLFSRAPLFSLNKADAKPLGGYEEIGASGRKVGTPSKSWMKLKTLSRSH
ncbi:hypothetical protein IB279_17340 [Ensifer sp. ENS06]|uniref:hypothetical protein n=1 Tax=Ensifer sp. ENS06 TaxID=2769276 RepID=UPI00177FD2CD|nr:hypothetical protein [Ensifer sp. ENS06]MBD9624714.1 hypothetical protein [Ensifer sp. ENS06]